jgi:hypothetical protein
MGRTPSVATTSAAVPSSRNWRPARPWKRGAVEKSKSRLSHRAWKSRKVRGIPTFPPPRRLREINPKPDISLATKSGRRFNLLATDHSGVLASEWPKNAAFYVTTRSPPERSLAPMIRVLHFFFGDNPERTRFVAEIVKSGEKLNNIHRFPGFEEARVSRNRLLSVVHAYTV